MDDHISSARQPRSVEWPERSKETGEVEEYGRAGGLSAVQRQTQEKCSGRVEADQGAEATLHSQRSRGDQRHAWHAQCVNGE